MHKLTPENVGFCTWLTQTVEGNSSLYLNFMHRSSWEKVPSQYSEF